MMQGSQKVFRCHDDRFGMGTLITGALMIVCGLILMQAGSQSAAQDAPTASAMPNAVESPHGVPDRCHECHKVDATGTLPQLRDATDALCLRCHDGKLAKAEDHPVGRIFDRPDLRRPEEFPALDNKLGCVTCHDVLLACRLDQQARVRNPSMLRGSIHSPSHAYCGQCHIIDTHQKLNPHRMLDVNAEMQAAACQHCHIQPMPSGSAARTHQPSLRAAEPDLCLGCHGMHVDFFDPGHSGAVAKPAIVRHMLAEDRAAGLALGDSPQVLPLAENHRVVCSTCHNPHQAGVFEPGSLLDRGAMSLPKSASGPTALRLQGKELCHACHGY